MMNIKQILRLIVIAGLTGNLIAACTKPAGEEVAFTPEPDLSAPIEFSEQITEPQTKGLDPLTSDNAEGIWKQRFGVFSWWNPIGEAFDETHNDPNLYQVNNDVEHVASSFTSGEHSWRCNPRAYWPFRCNLSFFAYAPYLEHTQPWEEGGEMQQPALLFPSADYTQGMPRVTYSPRTNVSNQVDLCIAAPVFDREPSTEPIHFAFQHALTRILLYVKAIGTPLPGNKYRITDAIISGIAGSNTFTYVNDVEHPFVWDDVTVSNPLDGEYHLTVANTQLVAAALNSDETPEHPTSAFYTTYSHINYPLNGRLYLLPQTLTASAQLELAVTAFAGDTQNVISIFPPFRVTLPDSQPWVAGQTIAYKVTIDISRVTVADIKPYIIPWADSGNVHEDEIIY